MAANKYGIDLAELYRTTAAVKGARTKRAMADLELSELETEIAERPEKQRIEEERQNVLSGLRQKIVGGDKQAQKRFLALDPEGGPKFLEAVSSMDDREKEEVQKSLDQMGRMTATILQADPEKRPALYAQMLTSVPEESRAKMPKEYDENFLNLSLAKQRSMDKILETKVEKVGSENILYKGGFESERADVPVKPGSGGGDGGTKSADEALIYRMSTELLGGIFDQAGNITNLDPQARNKAQAIATEAANLYTQHKGKLTRSEAVKRAARKFNLAVSDPAGSGADPADIRSYLLQ